MEGKYSNASHLLNRGKAYRFVSVVVSDMLGDTTLKFSLSIKSLACAVDSFLNFWPSLDRFVTLLTTSQPAAGVCSLVLSAANSVGV